MILLQVLAQLHNFSRSKIFCIKINRYMLKWYCFMGAFFAIDYISKVPVKQLVYFIKNDRKRKFSLFVTYIDSAMKRIS